MLAFMTAGSYAQEAPLAPAPPTPVPASVMPSLDKKEGTTGVKAKIPQIIKDERVALALEAKDLSYELCPNKIFRIPYRMAGGRHQNGMIASFNEKVNPADPSTPSIRRIWSIAYSGKDLPSAEILANLLTASGKVKVGAWEIIRGQNGDYTVLFNIKADADTPPDTLVWMLYVAVNNAETAEKAFEAADAAAHATVPNYKPGIDMF